MDIVVGPCWMVLLVVVVVGIIVPIPGLGSLLVVVAGIIGAAPMMWVLVGACCVRRSG